MTNKEKWDIALQEYIHESDNLEKARKGARILLFITALLSMPSEPLFERAEQTAADRSADLAPDGVHRRIRNPAKG